MWFLSLLILFTVNLTCCTIDRFPKVLKIVRNPRTKLDESLEKTMSLADGWKRRGPSGDFVSASRADGVFEIQLGTERLPAGHRVRFYPIWGNFVSREW